MTRHEMALILGARATFHGNMQVGAADVEAWHAAIGDLDYDDARQALISHYGHRPEFAMPSDVRNGVKRIRADRLERASVVQPPAGLDPDDVAGYLRWKRDQIRRDADPDSPVLRALP